LTDNHASPGRFVFLIAEAHGLELCKKLDRRKLKAAKGKIGMSYQHPVPPPMLKQIGDMTVSFGHLEFHMRSVFVYLVNQSGIVGEILGTYLSFSNLRAAISALYVQRFGEDERFSELTELLHEASKIEQERNAITHSAWIGGHTPLTITRHKVTAREKRGFKQQDEQYSEDKLSAFNQRIRHLTSRFIEFYQKLPDQIP
jgi:hypothetical protein